MLLEWHVTYMYTLVKRLDTETYCHDCRCISPFEISLDVATYVMIHWLDATFEPMMLSLCHVCFRNRNAHYSRRSLFGVHLHTLCLRAGSHLFEEPRRQDGPWNRRRFPNSEEPRAEDSQARRARNNILTQFHCLYHSRDTVTATCSVDTSLDTKAAFF
jgi:hypothetical protein